MENPPWRYLPTAPRHYHSLLPLGQGEESQELRGSWGAGAWGPAPEKPREPACPLPSQQAVSSLGYLEDT